MALKQGDRIGLVWGLRRATATQALRCARRCSRLLRGAATVIAGAH